MRLVDLTTKPWQLMLPGEKETSLNKMVYLPGTLDEFGVGHDLQESIRMKARHILSRKLRLHQQINAALSLRLSEPDVCVFI